jgi:hypothetical protein
MRQTVMTVITNVAPGRSDQLLGVLDKVSADPGGNPLLPLAAFDQLHFASLVMFDDEELGPKLVFEANVDGSADEWLTTLVAEAPEGVKALYDNCRGFPSAAAPAQVKAYLREHVVRPSAYHIGATGRSLERIRQERVLREAIEDHLDAERDAGRLAGQSPAAVRASIQRFVRSDPQFSWAESFPPRETTRERLGYYLRAAAFVLALIPLLPVLLLVAPLLVVVLRAKELTDRVQEAAPDPRHVRALAENEDCATQNHLASLIPVKAGMFRVVVLRAVLYALNLWTRIYGNKGELGGITSIHFAHWSAIDGGRQLMFLSNYDGSWESYLNEFIDRAAVGLTSVWSNTVGFPRTSFLVKGGARDGPRFKHWARTHQTPTSAWYRASAYHHLTLAVIDANSAIREGLFAPLGENEVQEWLQRF